MEGSRAVDKERRGLEEDEPMMAPRWWGLRSWNRHSTILLVVGFLFVLIGLSYAFSKPSQNRETALAALLQVAPLNFWGWIFVATGLLSMISTRWPPLSETWGYTALTGLCSGWSAAYLTGIIFFNSPWASLTQVILWGVLAFLWWAISGLPNPEKMVVIEDECR